MCKILSIVLGSALIATGALGSPFRALDAEKIGVAAGVKPSILPDGVVKLTWPRDDVPLKVDGVVVKPFAGLSSWAAFTATGSGAMMMGDTAVFQDEINPAIEAAFAHGLEVTALHNHFLFDEPKVFFMHIGGHGDAEGLASGVKAVWDAVKAVRAASAQPAQRFSGPDVVAGIINPVPLEKVLGIKPDVKDGMVKVTIGREGTMHGINVGGSMGLTTWAAFIGTDAIAAVDGDFIMSADEVQTVLHSLSASKINIVALHNHMIGEEPAVYFTHFWGKGSAIDLAKAIESALEAQKAVRKQIP